MNRSHPENGTSKEFQMLNRLSDRVKPDVNGKSRKLSAMGFSIGTPDKIIENIRVDFYQEGGRLVGGEVLVLGPSGDALTPNLLILSRMTYELQGDQTFEPPAEAVFTLKRALRNALMIINSQNN